jgi:hypothetical protein
LGYNTYIHGNVTGNSCVAILNKNVFFSKMENRKVKQVPCLEVGTSGRGRI